MAKSNEDVIDDVVESLIKDSDIRNTQKSEVSEHDDTEFQDVVSESDSDYEDVVNSEETRLSEEDIEVFHV